MSLQEILADAAIEHLDTTQPWTKRTPVAINEYIDEVTLIDAIPSKLTAK